MGYARLSKAAWVFRCAAIPLACWQAIALLNDTPVFGADKIWSPTGSGSWFIGPNWQPLFGVPGSSDTVMINNGGTANADTGTSSVSADRIEVGKDGTTGTMTVGGTARNVTINTDLDVGEIGNTFATGSVNVTSDGTVTINTALNVRVGNSTDFDVNVGSTGTGTGATANGTGRLTVNSATLLDVYDDLDVGQASAAVSSTANGNGTLSITSVGTVDIGGDLDVGQVGGDGIANGVGTVTINSVSSMLTGISMVVGRANGSAGVGNSGRGTVSITDTTTLSVGFGVVSNPGDLDVADAIVTGTQRATTFGSVTLTRVTANVKGRVNIGEIRGGSTNSATTTDATVSLINSKVTAATLDVATVLSTAGAAQGKLDLNASLADITGAVNLGEGSELLFTLAGTTRATGSTAAGQYGALNAGTMLLNGKLTVELGGGFNPALGNQFQIISATSATGAFDLISPPTLLGGLAWTVTSNTSGVLLTATLAGDYNGNGSVDAADFVVWRGQNGAASAYTTWRNNFGHPASGSGAIAGAAVPEPAITALISMLITMAGFGRWRRAKT